MKDKETALAAVSQDGRALESASEELKNDKEVVLAAVSQSGRALESASEGLKNDKEVVLAAVSQNGFAFQDASKELKNDKEVALAAISQNGFAFTDASEELKKDKEVVLAAVSQDGGVLQYVSEELQNDKEVALAAVSQDCYALEYASESLKGDPEIVKIAATQCSLGFEDYGASEPDLTFCMTSVALKADKDFVVSIVALNGWNAYALQPTTVYPDPLIPFTRDEVLLEVFPVESVGDIAGDLKAASAAYHSHMGNLVARAKACVAKKDAKLAAAQDAAQASAKHHLEIERLTAELSAMKADRDFKGAKAVKAKLDEVKDAPPPQSSEPKGPSGVADVDTLQLVNADAKRVQFADIHGADAPTGSNHAVGDPAKFGRLSALRWLSDAYRRKSDQLLEADDFDLAEVHDVAATVADELWKSVDWAKLFPERFERDFWGPLAYSS